MKKKGLIISTIVMVVVLIASLTTATYAWFSSSAAATVDQITLTAAAANGLLIGAKGAASPADYSDYRTGQVTWNGTNGYWTGDESGLGQNVSMYVGENPMSISSEKAVSYATAAITDTVITSAAWYKASGNGASRDNATIVAAGKQVDYVDLELGVTAAQADKVKQAWLTIHVHPTAAKLGMAAAVHFIVLVDGTPVIGALETTGEHIGEVKSTEGLTTFEGMSAYPGKSYTNNYTDSVTSGTYYSAAGTTGTHATVANDWTYVLPIYNSSTTLPSMTSIENVRIIAWIEGTDDACVVANAGTGATINFYFDYSEKYDETGAFTFTNGQLGNYGA